MSDNIAARPVPLDEILDTLRDVLDVLEDYSDVLDGDYDGPRPNKAMNMAGEVEQLLVRLEGFGEGVKP